jgi:hypothetical protein
MYSEHRRLSAVAVLIFLSSCSTNPVGWGGRYQVLQATNQSITIEYDKVMSSYEEILGVAKAHCNKAGRAAVSVEEDNSSKPKGLIQTHTFRCE